MSETIVHYAQHSETACGYDIVGGTFSVYVNKNGKTTIDDLYDEEEELDHTLQHTVNTEFVTCEECMLTSEFEEAKKNGV